MSKKINDIDKLCINYLVKNPLSTWKEIAEHLDVTERTIARRMQRLLNEDTFRVLGEVDPLILKKGGVHHIWIKCQLGLINEVSTSLKNMPNCKLLLSLTGSHDLMAEFHFDDYEEMLKYTFQIIPSTYGIHSYDNNAVLRYFKQASNKSYHQGKALTEEEEKLIELLLKNGRSTITELSSNLNLSTPTIKGMIDHLVQEKLLSHKVDIEPILIGYATEAIICLEIPPNEMPTVITTLQASQFTRCLLGTSGKSQVFWHVVHYDNHSLWNLVSELLKDFKTINHMNLNIVIHAYKRNGFIRPDILGNSLELS